MNTYYRNPGQPYPPHHGGGYNAGQYRTPHNGGGGYQQSPPTMGFHQTRDDNEEVSDYFRAIAYGERPCPEELRQVILGVVGEQTDSMLAQYGYSQQGGSWDDSHRRYKEVMEELRDIPNVAEAVKRASQHFDNLTDEDRKVLQQLLNRPSHKKMASMAGVPLDRFMQIKQGLEQKMKH